MSGRSSRAAFSASGPLAAVDTRKPGLGQVVGDQRGDVRLVVHDQDAMGHDGLFGRAIGRPRRLLDPAAGVRAAAVRCAVPLGSHLAVVMHDRVQNGRQHPAMLAALVAQPIEHELGDRCVPDQLGPAQDLKVPGNGRLGQVQHCLKVGDEQRRGGEAVEDPEPGGLRDRQQQVRGRGGLSYSRKRIYLRRNGRKGRPEGLP